VNVANLKLVSPLTGWSAPLEEVPDAVFAGRLLGDGLALDPTEGVLCAPCDGTVMNVPAQKHAITLRATNGAEILMHVGIDTVALNGEGFEVHVAAGAAVKAGERLMTFDLDLLARRATSLVTPVIVTDGAPFRIVSRVSDRAVRAGEFLMELAPVGAVAGPHTPQVGLPAAGVEMMARVIVPLEHGLHARPAAMLTNRIKTLAATVSLSARGRTANARSAISIMSLGVRKGDEVIISAVGPDAPTAVAALEAAIRTAVEEHAAPAAQVRLADGQFHGLPAPAPRPGAALAHASDASQPTALGNVVRAVIASPGVAIGIAHHLERARLSISETGGAPAEETARLAAARAKVRSALNDTASTGPAAAREIISAHLEFLDDPELLATAASHIASGKSAAYAWRTSLRANAEVLATLPDARMTERVDDLRDLEYQVLAALEGKASTAQYNLPDRAIVLANELLPSQFVALDRSRLAGICTSGGGPTSHVAVLAAAMDIPMLVAAGRNVLAIPDGAALILDANRGELHVAPDAATTRTTEETVARRRERNASDRATSHAECLTADGTRIEVFANASSVAEAEAAVSLGAEGCGLLRTEFLFLDRDSAPDEVTQADACQRIVSIFAQGVARPVVIRTLDAGADKPLAYLSMPREENPALGVRGLRVGLQNPDLLRTQLRAILRVQPRGSCRILLPMVTDAAEVRAVRALLDEVRRELAHDAAVSLGAMIETPASAMLADQIAHEADFLSIGTNDLTQYTLAMDRGNPALASRLDALHPAVLRLIATAARDGRAASRDVAVCGGLASDPVAAPILIGLGVNELSAVPSVIPRLKALIRALTLDQCIALAERALEADSAVAVRALVAEHEVLR
jgi:phosphocarrier protein FPr/phosphocarrier protein